MKQFFLSARRLNFSSALRFMVLALVDSSSFGAMTSYADDSSTQAGGRPNWIEVNGRTVSAACAELEKAGWTVDAIRENTTRE